MGVIGSTAINSTVLESEALAPAVVNIIGAAINSLAGNFGGIITIAILIQVFGAAIALMTHMVNKIRCLGSGYEYTDRSPQISFEIDPNISRQISMFSIKDEIRKVVRWMHKYL